MLLFSSSVRTFLFNTKSESREIPPPLPLVAYIGILASDSFSISRFIVLTETSSLSANSFAVMLSLSINRYTI